MEKINSEEFLENLIDNYGKLIFSICYQFTNNYFDAEDLAQETFLAAYRNYDKFDGVHEKAWLTKIATNKCLDYKKSASAKTVPTEEEYFTALQTEENHTEKNVLEEETKGHLKNICSELKPPYNQVAMDYFYYELSSKEIAEKEGKSIKTIQTQLYRAKAMLKKLWGKE